MPLTHRPLRLLVLIAAALALGTLVGFVAAPGAAVPHDVARTGTSAIISVTGTARYGFAIHHLDGTVEHPETRSEALAECLGYATATARARCRGDVTRWYADLGAMKRTTGYYRARLARSGG